MNGKIFYPLQGIEKAYQKIAAKKNDIEEEDIFMSWWKLKGKGGIESLTHY